MSVRVETDDKSTDSLIDKNVYELVFGPRFGSSWVNKASLVNLVIR